MESESISSWEELVLKVKTDVLQFHVWNRFKIILFAHADLKLNIVADILNKEIHWLHQFWLCLIMLLLVVWQWLLSHSTYQLKESLMQLFIILLFLLVWDHSSHFNGVIELVEKGVQSFIECSPLVIFVSSVLVYVVQSLLELLNVNNKVHIGFCMWCNVFHIYSYKVINL